MVTGDGGAQSSLSHSAANITTIWPPSDLITSESPEQHRYVWEEDQHTLLSRWWDGAGDKTLTVDIIHMQVTGTDTRHTAQPTLVTCNAAGQCSPALAWLLWGSIINVWCLYRVCCLYQATSLPVCNICIRLLSQYCSSLAVSPAERWDTNNGYQHHQTGIAGTGQLRPDLSILCSSGPLACDYGYIVPTIIP